MNTRETSAISEQEPSVSAASRWGMMIFVGVMLLLTALVLGDLFVHLVR